MKLSTISTGLSTIGMGGGDRAYQPDFNPTVDNAAVTRRLNRQPRCASSEYIYAPREANTRCHRRSNVRISPGIVRVEIVPSPLQTCERRTAVTRRKARRRPVFQALFLAL